MNDPPSERLTLRECSDKGVLERSNPHPRDKRLTFAEIGHHYYVDGVRHDQLNYLSSTTFLGTFFPKFNSEQCISFIMRSHKYANDSEYKYYRMSEDAILGYWKELGDQACSLGSFFHISAEYDCNGIPSGDDSPEFKQYLAFRADHPHLIPYRTEMLIFDETYRIVGSVDAIFLNLKTNKYLIVDWKRSKKVTGKGGDKGYWPLNHLRSSNLTKYSIQLSLYTYILEQNYGLEMEESALVVCHPNQTTYRNIRTKYMREDVETMLNYRLLGLYKKGTLPMPESIRSDQTIDWNLIS
jgi:hypothetical protein